mmetsp:Transcript_83843/g.211133  ORF Transcript_83843/g.211133 Transcript_83843/m.211133 type:complete len:846 (-) Transcript_83843:16-2553(-)
MDSGDSDRLGPPLDILPKSIEPAELLAFRVDYQAFRAGQALGARGEIGRLCPTPEGNEESNIWPPSPSRAEGWNETTVQGSRKLQVGGIPMSSCQAGVAGEVGDDIEAYYSEPERGVHSLVSNSPASETGTLGRKRPKTTQVDGSSPSATPTVGTPKAGPLLTAPFQQRGRQIAVARATPRGYADSSTLHHAPAQTSSSSSPSAQRALVRRAVRPVSVLRSPAGEQPEDDNMGSSPQQQSLAHPQQSAKSSWAECASMGAAAGSRLAHQCSGGISTGVPGGVMVRDTTTGTACANGGVAALVPTNLPTPAPVVVAGASMATASAISVAAAFGPQSCSASAMDADGTGASAKTAASQIIPGLSSVSASGRSAGNATEAAAAVAATACRRLDFQSWLADELGSRPDEAQLHRVPKSHLGEVADVLPRLEKLLGFGFLLCLDILLHELSFTPLQVVWSAWRLFFSRGRPIVCGQRATKASGRHRLTVTEQGDVIRLSLLLLNVALVSFLFDDSKLYHYIRRESFLKLYVIFNMLEMFERWCRSVGVDLFDLLAASARHPWPNLALKSVATLAYCFIHSAMHLLRVLLLNVAINTSSSAVFLLIVTNNFGEIKSTVFKKYTPETLFPIITSDIVERFYLVVDVAFVLARLSISPRRGAFSWSDIAQWMALLVVIEVFTDWIKFCLIFKFSNLEASTLEVHREVLLADILLCRSGGVADTSRLFAAGKLAAGASSAALGGAQPLGGKNSETVVPFRGIHSFSHALARRIGFCGIPFSTLVVVQAVMLLRSPCILALHTRQIVISALFLFMGFAIALLSKVLLAASLLGYAARRRWKIQKGLELFPKIKAL